MARRTSVGLSPAMASSSNRTFGSVASARAISSRLRPGVPRFRAGVSARVAIPTPLQHGERALPRLCGIGGAQEGAYHDVLHDRHVAERLRQLESAGEPELGTALGRAR